MSRGQTVIGVLLSAMIVLAPILVLAPTAADARAGGSYRFGGSGFISHGSRSFRTYQYNGGRPIQRSLTPRQSPGSSFAPGYRGYGHPFLGGLAGGFFGTWLGSMLFPHWGMGYGWGFPHVIGSVFSWLVIIGLVWMLIRVFGRGFRRATAPDAGPMAYRGLPPRGMGYGGGAPRGAPLAIAEADYRAFEAILKHVQGAWSQGDLAGLRPYLTPEMLSYFSEQLAENESRGVQNHVENVELLRGDLREAWDEGSLQYATAYLQWRALDYTVRTGGRPGDPDAVVEGDAQRPAEAAEIWTFARSPGGHWLLSAIQQV